MIYTQSALRSSLLQGLVPVDASRAASNALSFLSFSLVAETHTIHTASVTHSHVLSRTQSRILSAPKVTCAQIAGRLLSQFFRTVPNGPNAC